MTGDELRHWQDWIVGKPCPKHPQSLIKDGKWGNWCGNKTDLGTWCDGGWPTEEYKKLRLAELEANNMN